MGSARGVAARACARAVRAGRKQAGSSGAAGVGRGWWRGRR